MFWTDWSEKSSIMRAFMDGSSATAIVTQDIKWINSLAVDLGRNRIYWADAFYDKIETATLTGQDRQLVIQDKVNHPFNLEVFGDLLFWSDWQLREIQVSQLN
jgi:low density lipoprotein receptor-related protein 5/6